MTKHIQIIDKPVVAGQDSLEELGQMLDQKEYSESAFFILTDENSRAYCLPLLLDKTPRLNNAKVIEIKSGESNKSPEVAVSLWQILANSGADRQSVLINLGGGVVTDLGGFIASTFKRGIRFIHVPTSLMAQIDAAIGGKNAIDIGEIKNIAGTFALPEAVIVCPPLLSALPERHLCAGFVEMLKHGLIANKNYFYALCDIAPKDIVHNSELIEESIRIKASIINKDFNEKSIRKLLNFGHTIGHAIESFSLQMEDDTLLHGEAIAIGMICESYLSYKLTGLDENSLNYISNTLHSFTGAPVFTNNDIGIVADIMRHDKKISNGQHNFTLLKDIGKAGYNLAVKEDEIIESIEYYLSGN